MPGIVANIDIAAKCSCTPGGGWENTSVKDFYNPWALAVSIVRLFVPVFGLLGLFMPGRTREVRIKTGGLP